MLSYCEPYTAGSLPANKGDLPNAVSMLAYRLRRWPNIETALGECPVFAGHDHKTVNPFSGGGGDRLLIRQTLTSEDDPRTDRIKTIIMTVDP